MDDSTLQAIIDELAAAGADDLAGATVQLEQSDDPVLVLVAAVLGPEPDRALARATGLARSTRDRQLVAIGGAHLRGERDRVRALIRDHRVDHQDHPILAWILADDRGADPAPGAGR